MTESEIFQAALKLSPEDRAAYLDQVCRTNPELRGEVEALLRAHEVSGGILQDLPQRPARTGDYEPITERPGSVIGSYRLMEQIGEGGFGLVFVAEQTHPVRRKVALKIIKPGMDSKAVLARFEIERQALALMDHPNIAKVLDAGATPEGRPYFVMELVKGVPITRFCDARKLTPQQRLELFVPVCQAIQHAHQKGIVHRDIKPSNVLIALYDDRPVPKVIDFGIAKATGQALTDKTLMTGFGAVVGTPEYMSPEQASLNNLDIDTRSDVYSLGVLLYELLAGNPPFRSDELKKAGLLEMLRVVREEEPQRPSTKLSTSDALPAIAAARSIEPTKLTGLLRNELDWIVMKSLEKNRARRYETASGFAADVQRYMAGETVQAHPPGALYQLRKFARRHWAPLATVAAFAVLLVTAAGVCGWLAVAASREAAIAEQKREVAEAATREATDQRNRADAEAARAKANATETRRALDRISVEKGLHLVSESNMYAGLPWLVRPLEREREMSDDERRVHRQRVAMHLRYTPGTPKLRQMLFSERPFPNLHHDLSQFALSNDGKRFLAITGSLAQAEVKVWDTYRGTLIATLRHPTTVWSAQFTPDGTRVVTDVGGATVWTWDVASGRPLGDPFVDVGGLLLQPAIHLPLSPWQAVTRVCIQQALDRKWVMGPYDTNALSTQLSRDSRRALFTFKQTRRLIDLQSRKVLGQWPNHSDASVSPDGRAVLEVDGERVHVHVASEEKLSTGLLRHGSTVDTAAMSPDGTRILTVGSNKVARIWDAQTLMPLATIDLSGSKRTILETVRWDFSPDNNTVAGWDQAGITLLDVQGKKLVREHVDTSLVGRSSLFHFRWHPDGGQILWTSSVTPDEARVLDAVTMWSVSSRLPHREVMDALYAGDGKTIATVGRDGSIRIWEACDRDEMPQWQLPDIHDNPADLHLRIHLSPNAWTMEMSSTYTFDTVARAEKFEWLNPWPHVAAGEVFESGIVSPDKKRVITCHPGKIHRIQLLKLWDASSRKLVGLPIELPATAEDPRTGSRSVCASLAFSPDSRYFAVASYVYGALPPGTGTAQVYSSQTGGSVGKPMKHDGEVCFVAFSPDCKMVVTCSSDATAKLWDAETGMPISDGLKHGRTVTCAAFSPSGRTLATGSLDGMVRLWDVPSGNNVGVMPTRDGHPVSLAFHPKEPLLMVSLWGNLDRHSTGAITLIDLDSLQAICPTISRQNQQDRYQFRLRADGRFHFGLVDRRSYDLAPDTRPAGDLVKLGQLYTSHRLEPRGGAEPLGWQELQALWRELSSKYPDEFTVAPDAAIGWRVGQARAAANRGHSFAIDFHRRQLASELIVAGWQPGERGNAEMDRGNYLTRLCALALHGRHAEATEAADALAGHWSQDAGTVYSCACVLGLASRAMTANAALSNRYAEHSVVLLRRAVAAGYSDASHMEQDPDLKLLRNRVDFQKLMQEIKASSKK